MLNKNDISLELLYLTVALVKLTVVKVLLGFHTKKIFIIKNRSIRFHRVILQMFCRRVSNLLVIDFDGLHVRGLSGDRVRTICFIWLSPYNDHDDYNDNY